MSIYTTEAFAAPGRVCTTVASVALGLIYTTDAYAALGTVYTLPEPHLDLWALQGPMLAWTVSSTGL